MVDELLSQIRNSSGVAVARVVTNATTAASVLMTVSHQCFDGLQCFDAVGWAAGRASGL